MSRQNLSIPEQIDKLQAQGRYWFSYSSLASISGKTEKAVERAVSRLRHRGAIANPRKGFYVIVPPEYRSMACLPATWFVDDMMKFTGEYYYVGLLSAAELYGAAHHAPQQFQVITEHPHRDVKCGRVWIRFFSKRHIKHTPVAKIKTRTGYMQVSISEVTALDLIRYSFELGGLSTVAAVIAELCESLKPRQLVKAASVYELAVVQRLGFILDKLEEQQLTAALSAWLKKQRPRVIPLCSDKPASSAKLDERWHLKVNDEIDLEP